MAKNVFLTDEIYFTLNPPVNYQNDSVWSAGKKRVVHESRLVVEIAKFAKLIMVSAGVCYDSKGRLLNIPDKSKVNDELYVETLLLRLIEDCKSGFTFQQDGAPADTARLAQGFIITNCSEFIGKDEWHQTLQTSTLLIIKSGELCLNATRHFIPSRRTLTS